MDVQVCPSDRAVASCSRLRRAAPWPLQVICTVPVMFSYWAKPEDTLDLCRILNDHVAKVCKRHPTRFVGACGRTARAAGRGA